jgi:hypothetical protein
MSELQPWSGLRIFRLIRGRRPRRSHDDFDARRRPKIFRGSIAHVTNRRSLDLLASAEVIVEAQTNQFINGDSGGKGGIALVSDRLRTEELFLCASKLFFGKPVLWA